MLDLLARRRSLFLLGLWILAIVMVSRMSPYFLSWSSADYVLQFVPILGLLGLGQTLIMLSGGPGIDLSIGTNLSLSGVFLGFLASAGVNVWLAALGCLLLATLLGTLNGILVNVVGIPSLMATLATFFTYGGLAVALTNGLPLSGFPEGFAFLGQGRILGLPAQLILVFVPVALALHLMLTRTVWGNHIYAAGTNAHAARLFGIDVERLRTRLYALGGMLAGLGAILNASWFMTARPDAGDGMELMSVTIAVMGGTHIFGGQGRISGTVLAILIVVTLQTGLQLANVSSAWQLGVVGSLLIASIALDDLARRRTGRA